MAITMSGATVDQSSRDELNNIGTFSLGESNFILSPEEIQGLLSGNPQGKVVGITDDFHIAINSAITQYITKVKMTLNRLEALDPNVAFKGTGVNEAIVQFINSVKEVSFKYLNILNDSRKEIVIGVSKAYAQQDSDLQGNIKSDASKTSGF